MSIGEVLFRMLRNRDEVIAELANDFDQIQKTHEGLGKFLERIDEASVEEMRNQIKTLTKVMRRQTMTLGRPTGLMMIYVRGTNFTSDLVASMRKAGANPEDLLRELFRQKMRGD